VEWFYDETVDGHSRTTYMAGAEAGVTQHFRLEAYLVWQYTRLPQPDSTRALGLVAKWYY